jgi:hypothetical protein
MNCFCWGKVLALKIMRGLRRRLAPFEATRLMGELFIFAICGVTVAVKPETPEPLIIHSDQNSGTGRRINEL